MHDSILCALLKRALPLLLFLAMGVAAHDPNWPGIHEQANRVVVHATQLWTEFTSRTPAP